PWWLSGAFLRGRRLLLIAPLRRRAGRPRARRTHRRAGVAQPETTPPVRRTARAFARAAWRGRTLGGQPRVRPRPRQLPSGRRAPCGFDVRAGIARAPQPRQHAPEIRQREPEPPGGLGSERADHAEVGESAPELTVRRLGVALAWQPGIGEETAHRLGQCGPL